MRFEPFPQVNSKYGAPMGRMPSSVDARTILAQQKTLYARHQGGSDGYDKGGAYWGFPMDVWCVWARVDGEVVYSYIRAASREAAIAEVRKGD